MEIGQRPMEIITNHTNKLEYLELSIQISLSGLSFCVLDKSLDEIIALKAIKFNKKLNPSELVDELKIIFNTEDSLQNNFSKIHVVHDNELSTIVPQSLFDENNLSDYLKYNSKILKNDFIAFDHINANESVSVYMPYVNINNYIFDKFGEFTYKHISTVLIEHILLIERHSDILKFYVNVSDANFEIIVVYHRKLLFYNSFTFTSKEDFIYYLLFTAEQLQLDPESFNLIFIGDIDSTHDFYKMAYKYVRFVSFGNRDDQFQFKSNAQPVSNYSNFALIKSF